MLYIRGILAVIVTVSTLLTGVSASAGEDDGRPLKTYWNPQQLPHFIMTNVRDMIWLKTDESIGRARIVHTGEVCDNEGLIFKHRCFDVYIADNGKRRCKVMLRSDFAIGGIDYVKCVNKK